MEYYFYGILNEEKYFNKYHLWEHSVQDKGDNIIKTGSVVFVDHLKLSVRKKVQWQTVCYPWIAGACWVLRRYYEKTLCTILIAWSNKQLAKPWIRTPPSLG